MPPAHQRLVHDLSQMLHLLGAAFFHKHDERGEQQPVLNPQAAQLRLAADSLSTNLDNLPKETVALIPADRYSPGACGQACIAPFKYKAPSQFDFGNVVHVLFIVVTMK